MEYKAVWPFVPAGQENAGQHRYVPGKKAPATIVPHHYAQLQLQMMALGANKSVLVHYTVQQTTVRFVDNAAERGLVLGDAGLGVKGIDIPSAAPWRALPQNFGHKFDDSAYHAFLIKTTELCSVPPGLLLASENGVDNGVLFS